MEIHSTPMLGATTTANRPGVMRTPVVLATPAILQLVAPATRAPAQAAAGFATPPLQPAAPVALAAVGALAQAAATGILAPVVQLVFHPRDSSWYRRSASQRPNRLAHFLAQAWHYMELYGVIYPDTMTRVHVIVVNLE